MSFHPGAVPVSRDPHSFLYEKIRKNTKKIQIDFRRKNTTKYENKVEGELFFVTSLDGWLSVASVICGMLTLFSHTAVLAFLLGANVFSFPPFFLFYVPLLLVLFRILLFPLSLPWRFFHEAKSASRKIGENGQDSPQPKDDSCKAGFPVSR